MRFRIPRSYANVTSTLALVIAVSGGIAVAADRIGTSDIRSDAIKPRHLKFPLAGGHGINNEDVVSNGGVQTLLSDSFRIDDRGRVLPSALVMATGTTGGTVELRLRIDGKTVGGTWEQDIPAGVTDLVSFPDHPYGVLDAGKRHKIALQVSAGAGDVTFERAVLSGVLLPPNKEFAPQPGCVVANC
jgi:hypothetical protein